MLKRILSISGKPGLFELVSQGNNMLIVEDLANKRRCPAYANDKVISLADIAIYTEMDEVPLNDVFYSIKKLQDGKQVEINMKDSSVLREFFGKVLPDFDQIRVHDNDIKKVIKWYNLLIESGRGEFEEPKTNAE